MTGPRRDDPGDRLAELYDRFAASLFRYAAIILTDRAAAADAVHHVFLKLTRAGGAPEKLSPALEAAYLRRSVRNECYSRLREQRRSIVVAIDTATSRRSGAGGSDLGVDIRHVDR